MSRGIVDETEDWLPIGGLEPGFDENKPPRTGELVGKELEFLFEEDRRIIKKSKPGQSVNMALDLGAGKATLVIGTLVQDKEGLDRVRQEFLHATVNPSSRDVKVVPHERSADPVGKRVKYTYSSTHAYEHVFLNDHRYTWHCLSGPEKGLADTEHCDCF